MELINYFGYNAKVTLSLFFICLITLGLNYITKGKANKYIFSTKKDSLLKISTYIRLFTHILGHENWSHFANNYMKILLLGPMLEEKYGSLNFLIMILITAFITGVINHIKGKTRIYGSSGISFMLIVLSSFVNIIDNKIPLTFVLIILFYVIDEVKDILSRKKDGISHTAHLTGAVCGAIFGFLSLNNEISTLLLQFTAIRI